ncbi:hypothetical protein [Nocardia sp. NPDC060249]|uniref:hypothetical protein n=1 Tax=Nocardia sp. NPDC060249 TaxID=3347082 RepID=UPI003653823B
MIIAMIITGTPMSTATNTATTTIASSVAITSMTFMGTPYLNRCVETDRSRAFLQSPFGRLAVRTPVVAGFSHATPARHRTPTRPANRGRVPFISGFRCGTEDDEPDQHQHDRGGQQCCSDTTAEQQPDDGDDERHDKDHGSSPEMSAAADRRHRITY